MAEPPAALPSPYRIPVRRSAFHPATIGGVPRWVLMVNFGINFLWGLKLVPSRWLFLPFALFFAVHALFRWFQVRGPYHLRFCVRRLIRPIGHLER